MAERTSVYFKDLDLLKKANKRAESLDRNFSNYVISLIKKDLKK
jgi:hypothetical protein